MGRDVRGVWLVGLAALALVSCRREDDRAPFAESRTPAGLAARFFPPDGWAWGYLQLGDGPVRRYGVAAPRVAPLAEILIVPDYGETAETWFETARELSSRTDSSDECSARSRRTLGAWS